MIGRIYVEYHLTLLHTKYKSFIGLVVLEKKIFKCFSHYKPMEDNDAPGDVANFDPRVTIGRNNKGAY